MPLRYLNTTKGMVSMRTSIRFVIVMLALALSLFTVGASAQTTTTGSVEGTVTDVNGAAVPGVTVTVTGPNLLHPQSGTTNSEGLYHIQNIPPGIYVVTVESAKGFAKFEQTDVGVNLQKTSTVDVQLRPQGATETVEVTASSGAAIDVTSNTTGSNISTEQFSNFPTQRTVQSLYNLAPTVARSGLRDASGRDRDPSVAGSSGPENNYNLDGVNTTDPAFGGSGANLPFEFVQEVEIKTGAYGAEYGKATGGIFNVITKSGGNEFHGDIFGYGTTKGLVRSVKNFPFTGSAANGFSETDIGGDIGGPIKKDKLWFFGAFNPQRRTNFYLTQTFHTPAQNKVTIPFYAGKLTWALNGKNTLTGSTFGDFTKIDGFLATGALSNASGFGSDINAFQGRQETGGHNYTVRLNSTIRNNFIAEITSGIHFQRANTIPRAIDQPLIADNFAVLRGGAVLAVNQTGIDSGSTNTGFIDFVDGRGGSLQRGYARGPGFGLYSTQNRNRYEINAHMQNIAGKHTVKWGFEWFKVRYNIATLSSGPAITFSNPLAVTTVNLPQGAVATNGVRITNNFGVCTTRGIQDDYTFARNFQFNFGVRCDYAQAYNADGGTYIKFNNFWDDAAPRLGLTWDFAGKGKGKLFANYATFVETPIPLDVNVRAAGGNSQTDKNFNVNTLNAPSTATIATGFTPVNLGADATPLDPGLKPPSIGEYTAGFEYEVVRDLALGVRGIYRHERNVVEDGSFDDGNTYFIFNPGRNEPGTTERAACQGDVASGRAPRCFGRAQRFYRAVEFTATKRFTHNYQFIASYVFSSLTGNYEGLFCNDNGQSDPNITSLFDLQSLLDNTYGRLPNDRPHQFKFNGSYRTPFKLLVSGNFYMQSGSPFNQLIPHPVYGNNEGFAVQRGTAIVPTVTASQPGFPNVVNSIGSSRTPFTYNLDMSAYYPIKVGEKRELRLSADWFNVLNSQRAIRLDETFSINSGIPGVANIAAN